MTLSGPLKAVGELSAQRPPPCSALCLYSCSSRHLGSKARLQLLLFGSRSPVWGRFGCVHGAWSREGAAGLGAGAALPSVTRCPRRRVNLALAYTELTEELCRLRNLSSLQSQILRALLQEKSLNGGKRGRGRCEKWRARCLPSSSGLCSAPGQPFGSIPPGRTPPAAALQAPPSHPGCTQVPPS